MSYRHLAAIQTASYVMLDGQTEIIRYTRLGVVLRSLRNRTVSADVISRRMIKLEPVGHVSCLQGYFYNLRENRRIKYVPLS